ncbi:MAG: carbohydrate kinase, partial [Clostridia bacterium]|nr:carbohydrate kinase [Clostridia bacterium]
MACFDIAAIGELLIDMLPAGKSPRGNALLEVNPGGAPCNMLAMAANMGSRCAFIGKVGQDKLGEMLGSTIESLGIDTRGLIYDPNFTTTIAMVHLDTATGERDFTFVRKPGADIMLTFEEVDKAVIDGANILHFGSVSLTDEPCRGAVKQAVEYA